MPSTKPKVFAYLDDEIYQRIVDFKVKHQLSSDSQTLIAILKEYFGHSVKSNSVLSELTQQIESRLTSLESYHNSLNKLCFYSFGLAFARLQRLEEFIDTSATEINQERPTLTQVAQEAGRSLRHSPDLISVSIEPEGLSQAKLAKRLECDEQTVARHRIKDDFEQWSRAEDPDAIGWRYDPQLKKFFGVN